MARSDDTMKRWPPRPTWAGDFHRLEAQLFGSDLLRPDLVARVFADAHVPSRTPLRRRALDHYVLPIELPAVPIAGIDLMP
jgi:hypothetical protein